MRGDPLYVIQSAPEIVWDHSVLCNPDRMIEEMQQCFSLRLIIDQRESRFALSGMESEIAH